MVLTLRANGVLAHTEFSQAQHKYIYKKIEGGVGRQMKIFWVQTAPCECPNNKSLNGVKAHINHSHA